MLVACVLLWSLRLAREDFCFVKCRSLRRVGEVRSPTIIGALAELLLMIPRLEAAARQGKAEGGRPPFGLRKGCGTDDLVVAWEWWDDLFSCCRAGVPAKATRQVCSRTLWVLRWCSVAARCPSWDARGKGVGRKEGLLCCFLLSHVLRFRAAFFLYSVFYWELHLSYLRLLGSGLPKKKCCSTYIASEVYMFLNFYFLNKVDRGVAYFTLDRPDICLVCVCVSCVVVVRYGAFFFDVS